MSEQSAEKAQQYVITDLSIDGVIPTYGDPHPERTPIGPFDSHEQAWEYAHQMQLRYGTGGGSVDVSLLHAPLVCPPGKEPS